jgi:hypothetical protein
MCGEISQQGKLAYTGMRKFCVLATIKKEKAHEILHELLAFATKRGDF